MAAGEITSSLQDTIVIGPTSTQKDANPREAQTLVPVSSKGGLTQMPLSDTLKEIGQIRSEAAMLLLCSHASRLEAELHETRNEKKDVQKKSEEWMQAYHDEKEKCAVLSTELQAVSSKKNLQKIVGSIAGIIGGVAIQFVIPESTRGWGLAGSIAALALLVVGFWPSGFKRK